VTITIASLDNVPNPGSAITSPWAPDVTRLGVHVFASAAALAAATWPGLANGAHAYTTAENASWVRQSGSWVRVGLFGTPFTSSSIVGPAYAGGPVRLISFAGPVTTNVDADVVLQDSVSIAGGSVLAAGVVGTSTFNITASVRNDGVGNLTARLWAGATPAVSSTVAINWWCFLSP